MVIFRPGLTANGFTQPHQALVTIIPTLYRCFGITTIDTAEKIEIIFKRPPSNDYQSLADFFPNWIGEGNYGFQIFFVEKYIKSAFWVYEEAENVKCWWYKCKHKNIKNWKIHIIFDEKFPFHGQKFLALIIIERDRNCSV